MVTTQNTMVSRNEDPKLTTEDQTNHPPPTTRKRPSRGGLTVLTTGWPGQRKDHNAAERNIDTAEEAEDIADTGIRETTAENDANNDLIDPNEPRYCLCNGIYWGTMIGCDNENDCERDWFHLSCVGLEQKPPKHTKWYCPQCREKLKVGVETDGLVGVHVRLGPRREYVYKER